MPTSVQLNTRISPHIKQQGDAVFSRAGLSSSDVVRGVWAYAATHQEVPDFLKERVEESIMHHEAIRQGAGIARRLGESMGYHVVDDPLPHEVTRVNMYDAIIDDMEKEHVEA